MIYQGKIYRETEVKFFLSNPKKVIDKLELLNALSVQPRLYEINKYFDTDDFKLASKSSVLRLRYDTVAHITFKGPGQINQGVFSRDEIDLTLRDTTSAQQLLEALGFRVTFIFEKYRQTFSYEELLVTIDETPYGIFCELEGPNPCRIQELAIQLGLEWKNRINATYGDMFRIIKEKLNLPFRDLTFTNFVNISWRIQTYLTFFSEE